MGINIAVILLLLIQVSGNTADQQIFELKGGETPYEGRVFVYLEDDWMPVCDDSWGTDDADVVCNELGFSAGAMWVKSPRVEDKHVTSGCVYNVTCEQGTKYWSDCDYNTSQACNCTHAKASCNYYGYQGCYRSDKYDEDCDTTSNMTIQGCLECCRNYSFGLVQENKCRCNILNPDDDNATPGSNAICGRSCSGDKNHACGGSGPYYGVYETRMGACGGDYTENNGTVYSPHFPGYYDGNSSCNWSIMAVGDDHISFAFTIFNISDERYEIIITEEYNGSDTVLGQFNQTSPPTSEIYSCSDEIIIQLNTIGDSNGSVFFAVDFSGMQRTQCDDPDDVENGRTDSNSLCPHLSGDIVTVVCDLGYVVNATYSSVECQDGEWNASLPQCIEKIKTTSYTELTTSADNISVTVETTELTSTAVGQEPVSGISAGLVLGTVLGVAAVIILVVVLILLCCRWTKEREQRKVDETIILDEVSLYNLINCNENTQYDTIDEIPENVAETDVRPQQVNGDLPDKQQNVKAQNTGQTAVAGEYSEIVPEAYLLEGGVTQRSSGAGVMDDIIHETQSRSVVGDNSNGNGNRSDKGDETASPDAVRMSNIDIQDNHYDIVGESRGNTADTGARARRMNGGDPPDNSESVRDYDKSPTNTANEYSEIGPDSNLLPKEGDISHGDSGAGFVDNIAYEAQSPSVLNSSDNDQVKLSNVNTEESQYDIVGESRGNVVNSDARPQQTNMDLPDNDENVNARDVFSKSADSEYSEIGPDSNPSPNEGDITPRSADAGFVENVAYEEAQGPAIVGVISRDEDENSVRDEGSPAVEGVAKTDDESKSSSGFVDNVLYEGNEGWTL